MAKGRPRFLDNTLMDNNNKKNKVVRVEKELGLRTFVRGRKARESLTPEQRKCIELMSHTSVVGGKPYTLRQLGDLVGVHYQTVRNWLHTQIFLDELNIALSRTFSTMRRTAIIRFFEHINRGRPWALQQYLKATGDLRERVLVEHEDKTEDITKQSEEEINKQLKIIIGELGSRHLAKKMESEESKPGNIDKAMAIDVGSRESIGGLRNNRAKARITALTIRKEA